MRTFLLFATLGLTLTAQEPTPRHDKYRDDPHARCMRPEVVAYYGADDPSMHACSCHLVCTLHDDNADGVTDRGEQGETQECELWCTKSRCGCHPDDPCNSPQIDPGVAPPADDNPFDGTIVPRQE